MVTWLQKHPKPRSKSKLESCEQLHLPLRVERETLETAQKFNKI